MRGLKNTANWGPYSFFFEKKKTPTVKVDFHGGVYILATSLTQTPGALGALLRVCTKFRLAKGWDDVL